MSNIEYCEISLEFGEEGLELAERAAPGAFFVGREEYVEAEFDDDSGYYLRPSFYYSGLYDKNKNALKIIDDSAYEEMTRLSSDEDEEGGDYEHVSASEMVLRTGNADPQALDIISYEGDITDICSAAPEIVDSVVSWAISKDDEDLLRYILRNLEPSRYAIDEILEHDVKLSASVIHQPSLGASHITLMYEAFKEDSLDDQSVMQLMQQLAEHRRCPTPVLQDLAQRFEGARRPLPRAAELDHVAHNPDDEDPVGDLIFVASDVNTATYTLEFLSQSSVNEVRFTLAKCETLPVELLVRLATDPDESVRAAAFDHSLMNEVLLLELATHENAAVRAAVAGHPLTPAVVYSPESGQC